MNGFLSPSCTSMPCAWNQATKTIIEPKRISEIVVRKKLRSKMPADPSDDVRREETRMQELSQFDPRQSLHQNMTGERLSNFIHRISVANPNAVLLKSVEGMAIPTSGNFTLANIASEIMVDQSLSSDDAKVAKFLAKMCFSEKDVKTVEKMTRNQAKSKAWMEHREGRLTASKHHEYFTKVNRISRVKGDVRSKTTHLVASIIHREENLDHIQAIKWGIVTGKETGLETLEIAQYVIVLQKVDHMTKALPSEIGLNATYV